jgi:hypothetical protein
VFIVSTPNPATYPPGNPYHKHELSPGEFSALLERSFPALALFEQDYATALSLRPSANSAATGAGWSFMPAAHKPQQKPDYYLALCAHSQRALDQGLQAAKSIMYELPADRLGERIGELLTAVAALREQDRAIDAKNTHIAALEAEIRRQGQWAADLERQLLAVKQKWYMRLLSRLGPNP